MCKKQVIIFPISLLVFGFFLLTLVPLSPDAYAGTEGIVCCDNVEVIEDGSTCAIVSGCLVIGCLGSESSPVCNLETLNDPCTCIPQIPTVNQWGKIITIAVIGLFAVIGLIVMRRRSAAAN